MIGVCEVVSKEFHRNTRQRRVILEELRKLTSHPTAAELYEITRARLPKISLGTVYRNLELLTQMGMIQKLGLGAAEARFDGSIHPHDHVRCVHCGRVADANGMSLGPVKDQIESLGDYEILGYRLEFFGICPECRRAPVKEDDGSSHTGEQ